MGDNIYLGDRDSVRTPMQWSPDRNGGFSKADFAQLYLPPLMDAVYGADAVNVEAQQPQPGVVPALAARHARPPPGHARARRRLHGACSTCPNPSVLAYVRSGEVADCAARGPTPGLGPEPTGARRRSRAACSASRRPPASVLPVADGEDGLARPARPRPSCACTTSAASPSRPSSPSPAGPGRTPVEVLGPGAVPGHRRGALHHLPGPYGYLWFELTLPARGAAVIGAMLDLDEARRGRARARWSRPGWPARGDRLRCAVEVLRGRGAPGRAGPACSTSWPGWAAALAHLVVGLHDPGAELRAAAAARTTACSARFDDEHGPGRGRRRAVGRRAGPARDGRDLGRGARRRLRRAPTTTTRVVLDVDDAAQPHGVPVAHRRAASGGRDAGHPRRGRASTTWRPRSPCGGASGATSASSRSCSGRERRRLGARAHLAARPLRLGRPRPRRPAGTSRSRRARSAP